MQLLLFMKAAAAAAATVSVTAAVIVSVTHAVAVDVAMLPIRIAVTSYPFRTNQIKSLYEWRDNVETNAKITKNNFRTQQQHAILIMLTIDRMQERKRR